MPTAKLNNFYSIDYGKTFERLKRSKGMVPFLKILTLVYSIIMFPVKTGSLTVKLLAKKLFAKYKGLTFSRKI